MNKHISGESMRFSLFRPYYINWTCRGCQGNTYIYSLFIDPISIQRWLNMKQSVYYWLQLHNFIIKYKLTQTSQDTTQ